MAWELSVLAASAPNDAPLTVSGYQPTAPGAGVTIDGILWSGLTTGVSRVLLLNQGGSPGAPAQSNGVWIYQGLGNSMTRPVSDPFSHGGTLDNETVIRVSAGTALAHSEWICVTQGAITVDGTGLAPAPLAFSRRLLSSSQDFGTTGDGNTVKDGAMSSGSSTLSSASGPFKLLDQTKVIRVAGAGPSGADLVTTIASYTSPTQVTLASSASHTVSNAQVVWGTNNWSAIQTYLNTMAGMTYNSNVPTGTGVEARLPAGTYVVNDTSPSKAITLPNDTTLVGAAGVSYTSINTSLQRLAAAQAGTWTLSQASTVGTNTLSLNGSSAPIAGQSIGVMHADTNLYYDVISVSTGPAPWQVTVDRPLFIPLASTDPAASEENPLPHDIRIDGRGMTLTGTGGATGGLAVFAGCNKVTLRDVHVVPTSGVPAAVGIDFDGCREVLVERATFDMTGTSNAPPLQMEGNERSVFRDVRVRYNPPLAGSPYGVVISDSYSSGVEGSWVYNASFGFALTTLNAAGVNFGCIECWVRDCSAIGCSEGLSIAGSARGLIEGFSAYACSSQGIILSPGPNVLTASHRFVDCNATYCANTGVLIQPAAPATITGSTSPPLGLTNTDTLILSIDGGSAHTVTFSSSDTTLALVVSRINGTAGLAGVASAPASALVLTSPTTPTPPTPPPPSTGQIGRATSSVNITGGTALTKLGLPAAGASFAMATGSYVSDTHFKNLDVSGCAVFGLHAYDDVTVEGLVAKAFSGPTGSSGGPVYPLPVCIEPYVTARLSNVVIESKATTNGANHPWGLLLNGLRHEIDHAAVTLTDTNAIGVYCNAGTTVLRDIVVTTTGSNAIGIYIGAGTVILRDAVLVANYGGTGVYVNTGAALIIGRGCDFSLCTTALTVFGTVVLEQTGGLTALPTTGGTTTLSINQAYSTVIEVTGALTSDATIVVPNIPGLEYDVYNGTSGAHTVTVKPSGGTGFAVTQSKRARGYVNGSTAFVRVTADT